MSVPSLSALKKDEPLKHLIPLAIQALKNANIPTPELDVRWLLAHILKRPTSFLFSHPEYHLTPQELLQFTLLLQKRIEGIPYAYLIEEAEFWDITLTITPDVLIPRPETELLVKRALQEIPENQENHPYQILDLGTGSGAIGLAIAKHRPQAKITLVDFSVKALEIAQLNAQKLGLSNIICRHSHWFSSLSPDKHYHLILSNPPYLASDDPHLSGSIRYEPQTALVAQQNGLEDLKNIIETSPKYLTPQGKLMLEHGYQQGSSVRSLLQMTGFCQIKTHRDLAGLERMSEGIKNYEDP